MEVLARDIENIEAENTNKLQLLYIDFFNGIDRQKEIDYIRENKEIIDLMFKSMNGVHEYRMLTDYAYALANLKIVNKCSGCASRDVYNDNCKIVCNSCGVVGEYTGSVSIKKNVYNRIDYVQKLMEKILPDLPYNTKDLILRECKNVLYEFNRRYDIKSFSYPPMFHYVLKKLRLNEYIDRFPFTETEKVRKLHVEFYSSLN